VLPCEAFQVSTGVNIVWLKRDLRVQDHAALFGARKRGTVIAMYVVEPGYWTQSDVSARQWAFTAECLEPLQENLGRLGIPLLFFEGSAQKAFTKLVESVPIDNVHSHQETGNFWTYERDKTVGAALEGLGIAWHEHMQHGIFRNLDTRNGWAKRWDKMMSEPGSPMPATQEWPQSLVQSACECFTTTLPTPPLEHDPCPGRQKGSRELGLDLLDTFLSGRGETYRKAMSSPLEGADACSRLSPHIAAGSLSMREIYQATMARMGELDRDNPAHKPMRASLVSFIGRLHWHCHFMQKLETSPSIEWQELHPGYRGMRSDLDAEKLERWAKGETGLPFLDACMRSLQETGWLNFRMRAMVTAVASYHLWLPWQESGKVLARMFTDYEAGIHWPQTQMQSGTTGINTVRIYNPVKQGYDQDSDGIFTRHWVPELEGLEGKALQEPWTLENGHLHNRYPERVVDHLLAAKEARKKIWAVRKGEAFRKDAAQVLEKHSSRRSLRQPDHRRRHKLSPKAAKQDDAVNQKELPLDAG